MIGFDLESIAIGQRALHRLGTAKAKCLPVPLLQICMTFHGWIAMAGLLHDSHMGLPTDVP